MESEVMKSLLVKEVSNICKRCGEEIAKKAVEEYPTKTILWAYENMAPTNPMNWGVYEYRGKKYRIEISVKEVEHASGN